MTPNDWPDRIHVTHLREMLWRSPSRATVMVGAGMGRNALPQTEGIAPFPLWNDLAGALLNVLYPGERPWFGLDVMKLAQEYVEVYGRSALDERLKALIPDDQYLPGPLYEQLLTLPWADVFTTNYDRLLERTLPRISSRVYSTVLAPEDLVTAERPRIIKLHGSFPSRRPFVFTSEDYRCYPQRLAPFVNTVRQAVVETDLCLIGFSGDDPNFLQWIGWVRDQLAGSMRQVYLCGVNDLGESKRRYGVAPGCLSASDRKLVVMRCLTVTLLLLAAGGLSCATIDQISSDLGGSGGRPPRSDCTAHLGECLSTPMADERGSVYGEERCASCHKACRGQGAWPDWIKSMEKDWRKIGAADGGRIECCYAPCVAKTSQPYQRQKPRRRGIPRVPGRPRRRRPQTGGRRLRRCYRQRSTHRCPRIQSVAGGSRESARRLVGDARPIGLCPIARSRCGIRDLPATAAPFRT